MNGRDDASVTWALDEISRMVQGCLRDLDAERRHDYDRYTLHFIHGERAAFSDVLGMVRDLRREVTSQ